MPDQIDLAKQSIELRMMDELSTFGMTHSIKRLDQLVFFEDFNKLLEQ